MVDGDGDADARLKGVIGAVYRLMRDHGTYSALCTAVLADPAYEIVAAPVSSPPVVDIALTQTDPPAPWVAVDDAVFRVGKQALRLAILRDERRPPVTDVQVYSPANNECPPFGYHPVPMRSVRPGSSRPPPLWLCYSRVGVGVVTNLAMNASPAARAISVTPWARSASFSSSSSADAFLYVEKDERPLLLQSSLPVVAYLRPLLMGLRSRTPSSIMIALSSIKDVVGSGAADDALRDVVDQLVGVVSSEAMAAPSVPFYDEFIATLTGVVRRAVSLTVPRPDSLLFAVAASFQTQRRQQRREFLGGLLADALQRALLHREPDGRADDSPSLPSLFANAMAFPVGHEAFPGALNGTTVVQTGVTTAFAA